MKKTKQTVSLAGKLSVMTLALGAMAPLPSALAPISGIAEAHAQTNPCAPPPPKKTRRATNPCAPQQSRPANPCAPQKTKKKAKKNCEGPKNPCAPARKCDNG